MNINFLYSFTFEIFAPLYNGRFTLFDHTDHFSIYCLFFSTPTPFLLLGFVLLHRDVPSIKTEVTMVEYFSAL